MSGGFARDAVIFVKYSGNWAREDDSGLKMRRFAVVVVVVVVVWKFRYGHKFSHI